MKGVFMLMRTVSTYIGPNGIRLDEMILRDVDTGQPVNADDFRSELLPEEPSILYIGTMIIPVVDVDDSGRPMIINGKPVVRQQEMRFEIKANSVREAFEKYESSARDLYEKLQKESEKRMESEANKLFIPNAQETQAINNLKIVE
jgi:hypothetical protein